MIKGILFYFSCTGNTRVACEYIRENTKTIDLELMDIREYDEKICNIDDYSVIGLATFADFFGPSQKVFTFMEQVPKAKKPAFVLNTFGKVSGKTLLTMGKLLEKKGYFIAASYSLHTPENYPPMIVKNLTEVNAPNEKEMKWFCKFVDSINIIGKKLAVNQEIKTSKVKLDLFNVLMPVFSRRTAKNHMGQLYVDKLLCTTCGLCQRLCPYEAIVCAPFPGFDESRCFGCWSCFNHCPTKAIYTKKIKGKGHYRRPVPEYIIKLK